MRTSHSRLLMAIEDHASMPAWKQLAQQKSAGPARDGYLVRIRWRGRVISRWSQVYLTLTVPLCILDQEHHAAIQDRQEWTFSPQAVIFFSYNLRFYR